MDENVVFKISAKSDIQKAIADLNSFAAALGKFKTTDINVLTGGGATGVKTATQGTQGFAAALREEAVAINAISKVDLANIHANMARSAAQARSETTALVSSLETEAAVTRALASADAASIGAKAKLTTAKAAQTAASLRESKANEAVAVSAQKAAVSAQKAGIVQTELANRMTRAQAGTINSAMALANAQGKVSAAGKKIAIDLGAAGTAASRMASRFAFLASAVVAGFAFDVISNAAQDFAKLEGAVRGLEITATRAGVAGKRMFDDLTSGAEGFRFKMQDAADALNKLMIGGLRPAPGQMKFAGQVAAGASILFGEEPSKMLNDLATAALRVSYRMADNLGIVMRANTAYDMYAKRIGKTAKELTGLEKVQAFWEAMLNSSGAKALAAASSIETIGIQFNRAKVALNEFKLAIGEQIATSIVSMIQAFGKLNDETIKGAAYLLTFAAKVTMAVAGLRMLTTAAKAAYVALVSLNKSSIIMAALTAGVIAVTYAIDKMNAVYYATQQRMTDVVQIGVQFQQFMASMAYAPVEAAQAANELANALNRMGADSQFVQYATQTIDSIRAYGDALNDMVEKQKNASDSMKALGKSAQDQAKELADAAIKAIKSSDNQGEAHKRLDEAIRNTGLTMGELTAQIATAIILQNQSLVAGLTGWQRFLMGASEAYGAFAGLLESAVGGVVEAVRQTLNVAIREINKFISGLASIKIGITLPGIPGLPPGKGGPFVVAQKTLFRLGGVIPEIGPQGASIKDIGMLAPGARQFAEKELTARAMKGEDQAFLAKFKSQWEFSRWANQGYAAMVLGENRAKLQEAIDQIKQQFSFDKGLYPAVGGGGKGKGGKGKGGKSLTEVYKEAVEKLEEQLKEIDLQNKQLAEIYPTTSKTRQLEEDKLAHKQDEALLDFEITAKEKGFYDLLSKQHPELVKQIAAAKERLRIADKINEEYNKALQSAKENLEESKRENELRKQLGLAVDDTKIAQQNLDTAIKFAAEWGMSLVDSMRALNMSALDVKAAFNALRDEAQQAVDKARQLRLDWDLSQMSYNARLQAAREVDPNRRQAIGFNAAYDEFLRKFQEVGKTEPASQAAMELSQTLQDLQVEMEQTATDMRENLRKQGIDEVNQMLTTVANNVDQAMTALQPEGYVTKQENAAAAQLTAAENLSSSATDLTSSGVALGTSAVALGDAAGALGAAAGALAAAAQALGAAGGGGGAPPPGGGAPGLGAAVGAALWEDLSALSGGGYENVGPPAPAATSAAGKAASAFESRAKETALAQAAALKAASA